MAASIEYLPLALLIALFFYTYFKRYFERHSAESRCRDLTDAADDGKIIRVDFKAGRREAPPIELLKEDAGPSMQINIYLSEDASARFRAMMRVSGQDADQVVRDAFRLYESLLGLYAEGRPFAVTTAPNGSPSTSSALTRRVTAASHDSLPEPAHASAPSQPQGRSAY